MVRTVHITTGMAWRDTLADLRDVFQDWGVEREDWSVHELDPGHGVELRFAAPFEKQQHIVRSFSQRSKEANLRACYHHAKALQVNALRGVQAEFAGVDYLRLPPGSETEQSIPPEHRRPARAGATGRFRGLRAACDLLGIRETADREVAEAAYKAKARQAHPDIGGSAEDFQRLEDAKALIWLRRGWMPAGGQGVA